LDVSTLELDRLKSVKYITGTVPKQLSQAFTEALSTEFGPVYFELLDTVKEETGVLILAFPEDFEEVMAFSKSRGLTRSPLSFDLPPGDIIEANNAKIREIEEKESRLAEETGALLPHLDKLKIARDYFTALAARVRACENFAATRTVFALEGWTAESDAGELEEAVLKACGGEYYLELSPVEKDSGEVPIRLKNNKFVSAFEGITEMYSMPKYSELDPTPLLAPFYLLFFAMMFGDAGYGLVLAGGAFFALRFLNLKKGTKKFFLLFFYLGLASIAVGTLYGSFFGVTFFAPLDGKPILDLTGDIMFMIILSVAIGFVQIICGLIIKGYILVRDGKILDAVFDSLFWITAVSSLVGLIALGAFGADSPLGAVCGWTLAASLVGLACTQGRASKSIGGKIGNGINAVYGITSYVGDFVSYTRLMAIALSGSYIAFSFNLMGSLLVGDTHFLPAAVLKYICAAAIAVFGAALNMGLGALGAYVHSCRLQYVEYFGKFYEGGGVRFEAFGIKNKYVNITRRK
jgi:V/A-type H+-transporting ATPase subunit I